MRRFIEFVLSIIICAVFSACSSDNNSSEGGGDLSNAVTTGDNEHGATYVIVKGHVNLSVLNISGSSIEYGAEVSTSEEFTRPWVSRTKSVEGNKFETRIYDLTSNCKYYYRAYLRTGGINYYGKTKSFTTNELKNAITTGNISNITLSSAVATCGVSSLDSKESYRIGVAYSLTKEISKNSSLSESTVNFQTIKDNTISIDLKGLQPASTYYYCSYTSDGENYKFGEVKSFSTLSNSKYEYLNTLEPLDVSGVNAKLQGWSKLENLYGDKVGIKYYFNYTENIDDINIRSSSVQQVEAQNNNGNITANVSNLSTGTKYYYRVVAEVDNSIAAEGEILSFTTDIYSAPKGYSLVWQDEFNEGTELNKADWTHEVQKDHWVNNELQNYVNHTTPKGSLVSEIKDGSLRINCFKEDGKVYSARVYAKVKSGWKYGYIEARIKLPKGKGTWPAFWMMPVNFRSWPADGEIDIMEEVGYHPDYVSSSFHATAHVHTNGTQVTHEMYCKGAEGEFHTYAMEWTAQNITTYVDGNLQLSYNNRGLGRDDWPYDDPFYIILNLAWGGDWGGAQGVDESALPVTMEVDYVRVFQKK